MAGPPFLPFLVYHDITEHPRNVYDIGVGDFSRHLDRISERGWTTVSIGAFLDWQKGILDFPGKSIVLTFDDGYASHRDVVLPLLSERGMTASFFISAGLLGRDGYLSMDQVVRLRREGMEVGSHGLSHQPLSPMADADLEREMIDSRSILQDGVGCVVDLLSAPRGSYSRRVRLSAARAGYRAVCTSRIACNSRSSDPLDLGRLWMRGRKDIEAVTLGRGGRFVRQRCVQALREFAKASLGYDLYNRLRRLLLGAGAEKD